MCIVDSRYRVALTKYTGTFANKFRKPIVFDPVGMGASTYRKEGVQSANSVPLRASDRVKLTSYNRPLEYVASERYKR